jgi:hypothetical protein
MHLCNALYTASAILTATAMVGIGALIATWRTPRYRR